MNKETLEAKKRRRERIAIVVIAILFVLLTLLEVHLSKMSKTLPLVNTVFFFGLINFNIVLLALLVFLITRNVGKLFIERRKKALGSSLKTRLVVSFIGFSIVPTVILFSISAFYINSSFDKWFSLRVQNTLETSLEITNSYYNNSTRQVLHYVDNISDSFTKFADSTVILNNEKTKAFIEETRESTAIDFLEFYKSPLDEVIISRSKEHKNYDLPRLSIDLISRAFDGEKIAIVHHLGNGDLVRGIEQLKNSKGEIIGVAVADLLIPVSLASRVDEIASSFEDYKEIYPLRQPIKTMYLTILVMITLVILFATIWIGFYLAKELTVPLEGIIRATKLIAEGKLDAKVKTPPKSSNDEILALVNSFNNMTEELKDHRHKLEERRKYIEVIINNITSAVLSTDRNGVIVTVNKSAERFLKEKEEAILGFHYKKSLTKIPQLMEYLDSTWEDMHSFESHEDVATQPKYFSQQNENELSSIMAVVSPLYDVQRNFVGAIVVLDDLTSIIKAQRETAWREVARRIAHEIKNPLTPIKLSAQRLQRKYADINDNQILQECTRTIIENVDDLKELVNEFSNFARLPAAKPKIENILDVINDVISLYSNVENVKLVLTKENNIPQMELDKDQIKRVFINIFDNAIASIKDSVNASNGIIEAKLNFNSALKQVTIEIIDNGKGISKEDKNKLFEPYFSTKKEGTGLGLAIVKRIINDHNGFIRVISKENEGAKFVIDLPIHVLHGSYIERETTVSTEAKK